MREARMWTSDEIITVGVLNSRVCLKPLRTLNYHRHVSFVDVSKGLNLPRQFNDIDEDCSVLATTFSWRPC